MIDPDALILYYQCYHGRYDDPVLKFAQDYPPIDVSTDSLRQYLDEISAAVEAFTGKQEPPPKPPEPPFEWNSAYRKRFRVALASFVGQKPPTELVDDWLDENSNDLQEWVASRIPPWALAISVVEAAEKIVIEGVREFG